MEMFRFKPSIQVDYDTQGIIYFTSKLYNRLDPAAQKRILNLCLETGGEYYRALFEFVTTDSGATTVCAKYFLSDSTLRRIVKKYYERFAEEL